MSYNYKKNPTGARISTKDAIVTKRGKRIHFRDPETGAALCGAGLPNKQFPGGSAMRVFSPAPTVTLSCYRCTKILAMNKEMGNKDRPQLPDRPTRKRRRNPVPVREFYPTTRDKPVKSRKTGKIRDITHRDEHFMVLGGREGPHGTNEEDLDYTFETSPWQPGPSYARTQPSAWGEDKPPRSATRFKRKVYSNEEYAKEGRDDKWNKYNRLKASIKKRREEMEEAPIEVAELKAGYAQAKQKFGINPRRSNPHRQFFNPYEKLAEIDALGDEEILRRMKKWK